MPRTLACNRPQAKACCEIGSCFFQRERYWEGVYWYALVLTCAWDDRWVGFVAPNRYGYLLCIQLCVCRSRLSDPKREELFQELPSALSRISRWYATIGRSFRVRGPCGAFYMGDHH